jgi:CheY-like chemotaxis protein
MEILAAAKRATNITRQLLAFARQQTITPKVLDINEAVENMLKMIRRLIGEDIDVAWLPGTKIWPLKLDPSQVDQILTNLCVNARDAMTDVGTVTIETKNLSLDADYCAAHTGFTPGNFVLLTVSDNGEGMAPEVQEKIFDPFFTTKGVGQGTGLGLATVFGIVKQNKGFINVYSELKKGTTIKIYLPRYSGQDVQVQKHDSAEIQLGSGEKILLVEDDPSIQKLEEKILKDLGYNVVGTTSPNKAVKLAEEHIGELSLLLTDVVMPEMNGRVLSEKVQTISPNIKVLFMSGYNANVIAHRGVLDDGVHFISKPFTKKEIAMKVQDVLRSN